MQAGAGVAVDGATCLAAVGATGGQWVWCGAGVLPHVPSTHWGGQILCPAGAGTGATVQGGLTESLQPVAVSSLTVKGAGGLWAGGVRWLLGAGCWLMAASCAGGPRVLRGAGTDGGSESEWGGPRVPHLPTAPGATGVWRRPLCRCGWRRELGSTGQLQWGRRRAQLC